MKKSVEFISELVELNVHFKAQHDRTSRSMIIKIMSRGRIKTHVVFKGSGIIKINDLSFTEDTTQLQLLYNCGFYKEAYESYEKIKLQRELSASALSQNPNIGLSAQRILENTTLPLGIKRRMKRKP